MDIEEAKRRAHERMNDPPPKANGHTPPPLPPLIAVSAGDLATRDLPPRESVLGPWLTTKGLAMIYAPRGLGKTWLVLGIAVAIATGGSFLGWKAPKPRRVLVLDGEMPVQAMQERVAGLLSAAGLYELDMLQIVTPDLQSRPMPNLASEQGQADVAPLIASADVIVIDNLASLCRSGDENDRQPWLIMQGWLLQLRGEGKAVIAVHHSGKTGDQRGTSAREDVLDTVVRLKTPSNLAADEGLRCEWSFSKARGFHGEEANPIEVRLRADVDGVPLFEWTALEASLVRQVADLVNDGMSLRDIAGDMQLSKSKVHRLKKQAASMGLLARE